jgi:hypothetical protein
MLSVTFKPFMLIVVMLNVFMLSVVALHIYMSSGSNVIKPFLSVIYEFLC